MKSFNQKDILLRNKEIRVTIITFNTDGRREGTYGNMSPTSAMLHMAQQTSKGLRVLVINEEHCKKVGLPTLTSIEHKGDRRERLTYEEALPHAEESFKSLQQYFW